MAERDSFVVIFEKKGAKNDWKQLKKTLKESGITRVRASVWEDDPNLYVYPLDPRDFGKKGVIDRKIYTIKVPEEDADLASEIVIRLFPEYEPYDRRNAAGEDRAKDTEGDKNEEVPDHLTLSYVKRFVASHKFAAVLVIAFFTYMLVYTLYINPRQHATEELPLLQPATQSSQEYIDNTSVVMGEQTVQRNWYTYAMLGVMVMMPLLLIGSMFFNFSRQQRLQTYDKEPNQFFSDKVSAENRKTFDDIGGLKPLKEDLRSVVDFLGNPEKYNAAGADLPKGLLLIGPPGTGKTLIAQVMANEAHVGFLYANASDFVERYVGTGASRVRSLFRKARKETPCIVFIDEVDTLCGKRGHDMNAEDRKALTALLTEMDGFQKSDNILVIGATNRIEDIDEAALRPGRFTEIYTVPIPETVEERLEVIDIYMRNKKFAEDFDREQFAREMIGRSPAEIKGVLNEAAIISVQKGYPAINKECIEIAVYKRLMHGHQTDHNETDPEDLKMIAYHEAGHALIAYLTGGRVTKITIMPSTSGAGGVTFIAPFEKKLHTKAMMENKVMELYGGKVAEYLVGGKDWDKTSQGCANDIERATHILRDMVDAYGMSENALVNMRVLNRETGEKSAEYIVRMSEELRDRCVRLMEDNFRLLELLAETLLEKDTLYEEEINELLATQA